MNRVFLAREDGDGEPLRGALAAALPNLEVHFTTARVAAPAKGDTHFVLSLYPQSNDMSSQIAKLVPGSTHLVWFSYLDGYIEAVAEGLSGHVVFCAEDLPDRHNIYRREVTDAARKAAARAGVTYELWFGESPAPEGTRVSLTAPIECAITRRWGVAPSWGTSPRFVAALAAIVRRSLDHDD